MADTIHIDRDALNDAAQSVADIGNLIDMIPMTGPMRREIMQSLDVIMAAFGVTDAGRCEQSDELILPGDEYYNAGDGIYLSADHAPTVADEIEEVMDVLIPDDAVINEAGDTKAEVLAHLRTLDPASKRLSIWS